MTWVLERTQLAEDKAHGDAGDGAKGDAKFSETWVDKSIYDRDKDNDCQRVNVLHNIIRYAMQLHRGGCNNFSQHVGRI